MKALSKRHPITEHFVTQLELDAEASGIAKSTVSGELKHGFPKAVSMPFFALAFRIPLSEVLKWTEMIRNFY